MSMRTSAPKKFVIRPLKEPPKLPEDFEQKHWAMVTDALGIVLNQQDRPYSAETVYRSVDALCSINCAKRLHMHLLATLTAHVAECVGKLVSTGEVGVRHSAVRVTAQFWGSYTAALLHLHLLFMHLRSYLLQHTSDRSVGEMGTRIFAEEMKRFPQFAATVVTDFLSVIEEERNGYSVDRPALCSCRDMLLAVQEYFSLLEPRVVGDTERYYDAEGQRLVDEERLRAPAFVRHVDRRLHEERDRVASYLDLRSRHLVDAAVQMSLVKKYLPRVLADGGFRSLLGSRQLLGHFAPTTARGGDSPAGEAAGALEENLLQPSSTIAVAAASPSAEHLSLCFHLCHLKHVQLGDVLRARFREDIILTGHGVVHGPEEQVVTHCIQLYASCEAIVVECFSRNEKFFLSLREAFEVFIRPKENKVAELLARHVDGLLRETPNKMTEEEVEAHLEAALQLFNLIPSKDLFEALYSRDFARRLISQRSVSMDLERSSIRRLRAICGHGLAAKLEGMIKDIELSKDLMTEWTNRNPEGAGAMGELTVQVLQQGVWPTFAPLTPLLPATLNAQLEQFATFYHGKFQSRVLKWHALSSSATMKASFPKGSKKELQVSLLQALVLLQFNDADSRAYGAITRAISADGVEVALAVISLSAGAKILKRCSGSTKADIAATEEFSFNAEFQSKLTRIRVAQVQLRESCDENKETATKVLADRLYVVDAVIMRFMKARRVSTHGDLVNEVTRQLKFPATPSDIKKRIEVLIEREFLQRSVGDASKYEYVA